MTTELALSPHLSLPSNFSSHVPAQHLVNTGPGTSSTSTSTLFNQSLLTRGNSPIL
ncbi:hypothetical protein K435DRAFT_781810, partial [Dendrothele bispora CBS 962.96]